MALPNQKIALGCSITELTILLLPRNVPSFDRARLDCRGYRRYRGRLPLIVAPVKLRIV
jgi:hypothetical protein